RNRNVAVRLAEVTAIDAADRAVLTSNGPLGYDFLVIATGSVNNYFGIEPVERWAHGLKDLQQALRLREQVLGAFEQASVTADAAERRRILAFAVVGGGPTGVEYSGALAELIKHVLPKDFPNLDFSEVSV